VNWFVGFSRNKVNFSNYFQGHLPAKLPA
jgi:hypothetical protein